MSAIIAHAFAAQSLAQNLLDFFVIQLKVSAADMRVVLFRTVARPMLLLVLVVATIALVEKALDYSVTLWQALAARIIISGLTKLLRQGFAQT